MVFLWVVDFFGFFGVFLDAVYLQVAVDWFFFL